MGYVKKIMHIEILYPIFRCQDDEDVFLARLRELPGFSGIVRNESNLYLTLEGGIGSDVLQTVDEICHHWNISFRIVGASR